MAGNNQHRGGHEDSDVNVIAVGKVGVALLLVTIVAMALLVGVFNYFKIHDGGEARTIDPATVFPRPQLQKTPIPDLGTMRAEEDAVLNNYGWVDKQKGVVRIPIDRAMDLVLKKGLPARSAAPQIEQGVSVPTESGLGPKMMPPGGPLEAAK